MKRTSILKNIATALLLVAGIASCSQQDELIVNNEPEPSKAVKQTIQVKFGSGNDGVTRAVDADGHKSVSVDDKIAVLYGASGEGRYNHKAQANVDAFDATTNTATISVTLTDANKDDKFFMAYPDWYDGGGPFDVYLDASLMTYKLGTQDGTLESLSSNLDYCKVEGTLNGTTLPDNLTLDNQLCILKYTLLDVSDDNNITSSITSFGISDGTHNYTVNPSSLSTIYVAMLPISSAPFTFTASDGANIYKKTVASATLAAGGIYTTTLRMTKQVSNLGKVMGANGSIYATVAEAVAAGTTAAGMIAYEGTETGVVGKTNGLCISLVEGTESPVLYDAISFTDFPERPIDASDWAVPSAFQWARMLCACGSGTAIPDAEWKLAGAFAPGSIATMMATCGGTEFHTSSGNVYWTNFHYDSGNPSTSYRFRYNFYATMFSQCFDSDIDDYRNGYYRGVFAY